MANAEKISITLTPEMNRLIKSQVDSGRFGSTSELIREALRTWQKQEEEYEHRIAALRARVEASLSDPRPSLSIEEARSKFRDFISRQGS
jgi:antitoxin ParD1/3/4